MAGEGGFNVHFFTIWKIVNEVIKPKKDKEWTIFKEDGSSTSDHQEIADIFNSFFIKKVEDLKANIDKDYVMDPIEKLSSKTKSENTFSINLCAYLINHHKNC